MNTPNIFDIRSILKMIRNECSKKYSDSTLCEQYAWWLLEALTDLSRHSLIAKKFIELSSEQQIILHRWLDELVNRRKPIAYIIGWTPFLDLKIKVQSPLLIPRPETEEWTAHVIHLLQQYSRKPLSILDLCTGTGCIGLAIAKAYPDWKVTALDINPVAIEITTENARVNEIENIEILKSDLFTGVQGKTFDLILTNPPYISAEEFETLDESVKLWEDYKALVADNNGFELIEKIIVQAPTYLKQPPLLKNIGNLWVEIGHQQARTVEQYMHENKYTQVQSYVDMSRKERVVIGTYEAKEQSSADHASD